MNDRLKRKSRAFGDQGDVESTTNIRMSTVEKLKLKPSC
jgi:hypothetical protein